jgi:prepilin signal peptidase PulO-like enzyme (type II secretory pathway)
VEPLAFFLLGLPAAVLAERLIYHLGAPPEPDETDDSPRRPLPWQTDRGAVTVRWSLAACLPVLMAIAAWRFDLLQALAVSALVVALLVCTGTDLLRYRVPNVITYPGILLALAAAALMPNAGLASALGAAAVGGGAFLVMAILTRGGIGLGDVKLAALIGAGLGLPAAYQALFLGVLAGGLVMAVLLAAGLVSRRQALPYAPFLALAAVAVIYLRGAAFAPL